ncbi:hypothetical protein [Pseudoalteromonas luteoviolacea]|uniref:Uncharacterized protein n=1 Tax=Pseudoalteromonas luteoviolacea S4054 TaxID=1129367 RepID=A0A0F6A6K3_9GAMM|nr:hypothetical protein [Pseudoalteromonas luteoviolacea]AOT10516.1 hypothetical protein S4054249_21870 [Pseudoalteromonas luteoviolacea]AOT15416.1 hypothetical protein S40542_21725 [Pseudoalteromonas luteoviolacea]AOT20335.1 hypothetical protein S4054_21785 [Pseudoalteromonas luteoviolacea]KKE81466.1 hypothetical protein N479_03000 [Pseudoalteromonas luteoviolacea S4054]KZN71637.1 hypothetical protein N481_18380 [Pseudoalteromonas luteoviolacea S4047-1]
MKKLKKLATFTSYLMFFLTIFILMSKSTIDDVIYHDLQEVKLRVSLDKHRLPLADPMLNYSGDPDALASYIKDINYSLSEQNSRVELVSISNTPLLPSEGLSVEHLNAPGNRTYMLFKLNTEQNKFLLIFPVVFAILNFALLKNISRRKYKVQVRDNIKPVLPQKTVLQIDLYSKTLQLTSDKETKVQLANKPLCFYLALLEYCKDYPDASLNQNKDLPDELLDMADKYFHRLVALGHTIRKRPNFSNSLEKTLSEIRASLDELLISSPDLKAKYYPPKAHGEGSRSKLHSYALTNIVDNDINIIGK